MSKVLDYLLSRPLLCTQEAAEIAALIASRDPEAPQTEVRSVGVAPKPDTSRVEMGKRNGVSVIPARGGISRYTTMMQDLGCGGVSVDSLTNDIRMAVADPTTRCVVLDCDSPGGEANGIGELATFIRRMDAVKPVYAYVGGQASSGMLWIASACRQIACAEMSMLGSVGCVHGQRITADKPGVKTYKFVSSQSPLKQADPSTIEGAASIQAHCDAVADVFINNVASLRGVSREHVLSAFGKGGEMLGSDAVAVGMADGVSDFETVLGRLSRGLPAVDKPAPKAKPPEPSPKAVSASGTKPKGPSMFNLPKLISWAKSNPEVAAMVTDAEGDAVQDATAAVVALASGKAPAVVAAETVEEMRAQIKAELATEHFKAIEATVKASGESWFNGLVAAGKAVPADKGKTLVHYVEASLLDLTKGPLSYTDATGTVQTVTRVSAIVAGVQPPAVDKTKPAVATTPEAAAKLAAVAGLTTLDSEPADADAVASANRKKAMLNATDEGKASLKTK